MSFRQKFDNTQETNDSRLRDIEWLEQFQYKSETGIRASFRNEDDLFRFYITLGRYQDAPNFVISNPRIFSTLQTMIDENFWFARKQAELEKMRDFVLPPRDVTHQEKDPAPIALSIIRKRDEIITSQKKSKDDSLEAKLLNLLRKMSVNELAAFIRSPEKHPDYLQFYTVVEESLKHDRPSAEQYVCYALICADITKLDHAFLDECINLVERDAGQDVVAVLDRISEIVEYRNEGFLALITRDHDRRNHGLNHDTSDMPANFSGVVLSGVDASRFDWGANLRSFNLSGARLDHCQFQNADLRGTNLTGAILEDVNLSYANLSGAIINNVTIGNGVIINDPVLFSREQGVLSAEEAKNYINGFRSLNIPDDVISRQFNRYVADLPAQDAQKIEALVNLSKIMFEKVEKKHPGKAATEQTDYRGKNVVASTTKKKGLLSRLSMLSRSDKHIDAADPKDAKAKPGKKNY